MAKRSKSTFRIDCIRALLVAVFASALGLCANAFSSKPLPLIPKVEPGIPAKPVTITISELVAAMKSNASLLVLDVRGKDDFDTGHIPAAYNVPADELPQASAELAGMFRAAATLVTMCDGDECDKATHAAKQLRELGYADVRVLKGGWEAYLQAKLPTQETPR